MTSSCYRQNLASVLMSLDKVVPIIQTDGSQIWMSKNLKECIIVLMQMVSTKSFFSPSFNICLKIT